MIAKLDNFFTIIAGPNGSGKTTFVGEAYPEYIQQGLFLNADQFAEKINPTDVGKVAITAGKKFLEDLDSRLNENKSVIIETTLSGKYLLNKIKLAKKRGYLTRLIFLWMDSIELCDFRVKGRVAAGGHNIPIKDIERRYVRGLRNLYEFLNLVDEYEVFYSTETPKLICIKTKNKLPEIKNKELYSLFSSLLD